MVFAVLAAPLFSLNGQSEFSEKERRYFWRLAEAYPNHKVYLPQNHLTHTVYKVAEGYLFKGKLLGQGNWGKVFRALYCKTNGGISEECVMKTEYAENRVGKLVNSVVNIRETMRREALTFKNFYGFGEYLEITEPGSNAITFAIVMPLLGETNLEKLLEQPQLLELIPLREWVGLFARITILVDAFHKSTAFLHDDIKPANIGVTVNYCGYGKWLVFTQGNILDFGNAHHPDTLHRPGDKKYQPPEIFSHKKRTRKVDVFTLGKTFLEAFTIVGKNGTYGPPEYVLLCECTQLLLRMIAPNPADRPELSTVLNELIKIIHNFDDFLARL